MRVIRSGKGGASDEEPNNLLDLLRGTKKNMETKINPFVDVTYGGFIFSGDYRAIPGVMKRIEESVLPVMEKGNEAAAKLGILPMAAKPDNGEDVV